MPAAHAEYPPDEPRGCAVLRHSCFHERPPVFAFSPDESDPLVFPAPESLHPVCQYLGIRTNIVRTTFTENGFRLVYEAVPQFAVTWVRSQRCAFYRCVGRGQKVNHFPASFELGRKDLLTANIAERRARWPDAYAFYPQAFQLPAERRLLEEDMRRTGGLYIQKPAASSRGRGIRVVRRAPTAADGDVLVQRYIDPPLLVNGLKFDIRLYALVTSMRPLRAYLFREGLARFATRPYAPLAATAPEDVPFTHLTNFSLNRDSAAYTAPATAAGDDAASKWRLSRLTAHLSARGVDTDALWAEVRAIILKTLIAAEPKIAAATARHMPARDSCCEIFGFDVMLDADARPWLLEVNTSPATGTATPLDLAVKRPMIRGFLNIVGIRRNTRAERERLRPRTPPAGSAFSAEEALVIAEAVEERERAAHTAWEPLFPTDTTREFLRFFRDVSPETRLLQTWFEAPREDMLPYTRRVASAE